MPPQPGPVDGQQTNHGPSSSQAKSLHGQVSLLVNSWRPYIGHQSCHHVKGQVAGQVVGQVKIQQFQKYNLDNFHLLYNLMGLLIYHVMYTM